MTSTQLERLADLLLDLYEQPGLNGAERDRVSSVRFIVIQAIDGERKLT